MEEYEGAIGVVYRRRKEIEFLLIHNKRSGNDTFPAGGREKGEISSLQTVQREIEEETGYEKHDYIMQSTNIVNKFVYGECKTERAGKLVRQPVYIAQIITDKDPSPNDSSVGIEGWYNYKIIREKLTFNDSKEILDKISILIK